MTLLWPITCRQKLYMLLPGVVHQTSFMTFSSLLPQTNWKWTLMVTVGALPWRLQGVYIGFLSLYFPLLIPYYFIWAWNKLLLGQASKILWLISLLLLLFTHQVTFDSATPHLAPLSMGFPRREHRSRLLFPSPGDLLDPGVESHLLHWQADSLLPNHQGSLSLTASNFTLWMLSYFD